jgi:antitoxin component YwqK of YwqJK toxin-antitoxin module
MPAEPAALPADAAFNSEFDAWEQSEKDAAGVRHGSCRLYRSDGSLKLECRFSAGVLSGPFTAYHPKGELARRGSYLDGKFDGTVASFASDDANAEPLRTCCVPPGARELRAVYSAGVMERETFFDAEGRALCSDGTPWPERAASVPEDVEYDAGAGCWRLSSSGAGGSTLYRYFALDGARIQEDEFVSGHRRSTRRYDARGELADERHFDEGGVAQGHYRRRYGESPFDDARIVIEEGTFVDGRPADECRLYAADGTLVRSVELGRPVDAAALLASPVISADVPEASFCDALASEKRVREALVAAARRLACERDPHRFDAFVERWVPRGSAAVASQRAHEVETKSDVSIADVLDALVTGAEPPRCLRLLASLLPHANAAALDLVEAALVLAPGDTRAHLTRALLRLERGDRAGFRGDVVVVERESADAAQAMLDLERVTFCDFSFWPANEPVPLPDSPELGEIGLGQPVEQVVRAIQIYATRIGRIREALVRRLDAEPSALPAWLPPDLSFLLPDGPVELRAFQATITDETEAGPESSDVDIDERLATDVERGISAWMQRARADWAALCWLCWAAGLDRVALPERLVKRTEFAVAVDRATSRCYRAHDQLRSAGLVSRARGVAEFEWEGIPVSELSPTLAEIAASELLETRAALFWSLFPENVSPFQSDLRRV